MNPPKSKSRPCPLCKKAAAREDNPAYPFCSDRCKLQDLGAWLDGRYRVPDEPTPPWLDEFPDDTPDSP